MLAQADDFRAEGNELHALLTTLDESDWARSTLFKDWTINDIVQHLHDSDLLAAASIVGTEPFAQLRAEVQTLRDSGMSRLQVTRHRLGHLTGKRLLETWFAQVVELCEMLTLLSPDTRLQWVGPGMGVRMFTTARQMETWAHGQAIYDLMGAARQPTHRLRNIAEIGVRTYGWTFTNRGLPIPGPAPYVRLEGPAGTFWGWNDPSSDSAVTGTALDFCQIVTQVRNVADTTINTTGESAGAWMNLAQCFAGPPENPPPVGTRLTATSLRSTAQ